MLVIPCHGDDFKGGVALNNTINELYMLNDTHTYVPMFP
jgi:hypothetical protein